MEAGVEDQLKIGRVWHFWYKLILVHHLRHIESLFTEHLPQFLPPLQSLVLIGQVDHLRTHSPDFPRNVFRWERPPCSPPLEELQRDLASPQTSCLLELARECRHLPTQVRVEAGRGSP